MIWHMRHAKWRQNFFRTWIKNTILRLQAIFWDYAAIVASVLCGTSECKKKLFWVLSAHTFYLDIYILNPKARCIINIYKIFDHQEYIHRSYVEVLRVICIA